MVSEVKENFELKAQSIFFSRAFLLSKNVYQENDLIVELLLDRSLRVAALARSARRSIKRFGGSLEPLQLLEVQLTVPRSGLHFDRLLILNSSETRENFSHYRLDYKRLETGLFFNALIRDLFPRGELEANTFQVAEEIFRLGQMPTKNAYADDWKRLYVWMWLSLRLGYGQLGDSSTPQAPGLLREKLGDGHEPWMAALRRPLQHESVSEIVEIFADVAIEKNVLKDLYSDWVNRSHLRCASLEAWIGVTP